MRVAGLGYYLPENIITNDQLLQMILDNAKAKVDIEGLRKKLDLNKAQTRHLRNPDETPLKMATIAAKRCLEKSNFDAKNIDLIIYAGMAREYIEPSMAVILQNTIGSNATCAFDISNACLSFLNAMSIAKTYIAAGTYNNILIVSSETGSDWIPWDKFSTNKETTGFSALTISDGAVAMLLQPGGSEHNFEYFDFKTFGEYNNLCQIPIGKTETDLKIAVKSRQLVMVALKLLPDFIPRFLHLAKDTLGRLDIWFFHQVTGDPSKFYGPLENDLEKLSYLTFQNVGNTGSAAIPLGMAIAEENNALKRGDCVACIVGASGFSYGGTFFVY
jgi:3-oxoacyl-[acyl-carrier-protein] synthase III